MGLGRLLPVRAHQRSIVHEVTNTVTGASSTFTIFGPPDLAPSWAPGPYGGALAIPAAWRAATMLAGLVGELPWHAYRGRAGGPAVRVDPTPPMLEDPTAGLDTRITTFSSWMLDYLFHGNALGIVASRNSAGWPSSFYPVPAEWVSVRPVVGAAVFDALGRVAEPVEYAVGSRVYAPRDVLHVKGPCEPGALRGMGVLEAALATFSLAREQDRQAGTLARHGVPTGVLESSNPDITVEQLREAKTAWMEDAGTRTIKALAPGVKFTAIAWNPEEMQLAEGRRMSDQRIAQLFGVPLRYLAMESGGLTYSTPALDSVDLLKTTINAHLVRFEQALSRHMPRGVWAQANRDAILRTDTLTRYQAHAIATAGAAWMDPAEVRTLEDLPPSAAAEPAPSPGETDDSVLDDTTGDDTAADAAVDPTMKEA